MTALWCEHAWLGGAEAGAGVRVEIDGRADRERARGRRARQTTTSGCSGLTIPGLANAHSHAFQRALRGRAQGPGSFWTWREQMYALAETIDPDGLHRLARATFAEMALAGITVVGEFHYLHHAPGGAPYADPNELGRAVIAAAAEAGIRIVLLDACYLHGGSARFRDAERRGVGRARRRSSTRRAGAAIHSVRAVDPAAARVVAGWAAARGAPLHAHVSEQPAENAFAAGEFGATPTAVLAEAGALSERFTAIHATHPTRRRHRAARRRGRDGLPVPDDRARPRRRHRAGPRARGRRRAARAGQRLACGHRPARGGARRRARRAPGLRRARASHGRPSCSSAATAGGYASLGLPDGGRIAPGALADLTTVALDSVRLAGTPPLDGVVFCAERRRRARRHGRRALDRARRRARVDRRRARAARGARAMSHARDRQHRPARHERPRARNACATRRSCSTASAWRR